MSPKENKNIHPQAKIKIGFLTYYENTRSDLGHYYNHLFNMLKFVDESKHPNKIFYINIVKSQLSSFELALLFYFGLSGINKLSQLLINKYSLLENVPFDHLILDKHLNYYDKNAFGENKE